MGASFIHFHAFTLIVIFLKKEQIWGTLSTAPND
jgi:hypothetical protein